jgi:hypothetical protein
MAWPPPRPPHDPSLFVPLKRGDPRLATDRWRQVSEERRAHEHERQQREPEAAEIAHKQSQPKGS